MPRIARGARCLGLAGALAVGIASLSSFVSPAKALVIGPGETATVAFDFSAFVDGSTPQPLTFNFEVVTSTADPFDDFFGVFSYRLLGIGTDPFSPLPGGVPGVDSGYAALGETSLGILSYTIDTTDVVGELKFGTLTESIEVVSLSMWLTDGFATDLLEPVELTLPSSVDVAIPEPRTGALIVLSLGAIALLRVRRRLPVRAR